MTSKYDPVVHNCMNNLKSNAKVMIVAFIFHLFAAPLLLINNMYNIINQRSSSPSESMPILAAVISFIAIMLGIICTFTNFRYLYDKKQVDTALLLPLSSKQKFLSDFVSGILSSVIPFIASGFFTAVLMIIGLIGFDGHEFSYYDSQECYKTFTCTIFGDTLLPIIAKCFLFGIIAIVMLQTLTALTIVCCGTLDSAAIHTFLINLFIPLFLVLLYYNEFTDHFYFNFNKLFYTLIGWTSPAGSIISLYMYFASSEISFAEIIIGNLIFSLLYLGAAYFLYLKRRAEQVSKPLVFKGFYAVTITLMLWTAITAIFGSEVNFYSSSARSLLVYAFVTFCAYMLFEIIARRGLKGIWKGAVRYIVTTAAFLSFIVIINYTRCFGIEFKVPKADKVDKIYISYHGTFSDLPWYRGNIENNLDEYGVYVLESEENIERVINAHRSITENIKKEMPIGMDIFTNEQSEDSIQSIYAPFSVYYKMKNGSTLSRQYQSITTEAFEYMAEVEISDEFLKQRADMSKEYTYEEFCKEYDYFDFGYGDEPVIIVNNSKNPAQTDDSNCYTLTEELYNSFFECLREDILDFTKEEYFTPCSNKLYTVYIPPIEYLYIDGSFDRTLKPLAENNMLKSVSISEMLDNNNLRISISKDKFTGNAEAAIWGKNNNINESDLTELLNSDQIKYIVNYSEELEQLLNVMQQRYFSTEPCYTLTKNGTIFYIPEQYSEIAEIVYNSAENPQDYSEQPLFGSK